MRSTLISGLKRIDTKAAVDLITKRLKMLYEELNASGIILEVRNTINSFINIIVAVRCVGRNYCYGIYFEGSEGGSKNIDRLYRLTRFNLLRMDIRHIYRYIKRNIPEVTLTTKKPVKYINLENDLKVLFLREYARENNLILSEDICRSEWLTGAFDKYYINNADVLPLTGLYKTQLRVIARALRIAHLMKNTIENKYWIELKKDLGIESLPDEKIDAVLYGITDYRWGIKEITSDLNLDSDIVEKIRLVIETSDFIRHTPITF